jgi:membrane protein implicated in regulation of membrane protease activity
MRKVGKKLLTNAGSETNVYALKGKTGRITKEIPVNGRGYVKVGGEEWSAVEKNNQLLTIDTNVVIVDVEGNKLIVEKQD